MLEYHCYLNNTDVQVNINPGHTIYINILHYATYEVLEMASSNSEECLTLGKQITVNCWKFLFKTCLYDAPDDCLKNMLCVWTVLINTLYQTCLRLIVTWHQMG